MLPKATNDHYEALREELKNNNEPGVWVGQMCRKLEIENPVVAEFLYRLLDRFKGRRWFPHAAHCACAMYRLLELPTGQLPRVKPEIGAPMVTEFLRNTKEFQTKWIRRLISENLLATTVIADYIFECLFRGGTEKDLAYVSLAGIVVYQYLARQHEADELARLPLA
jgi:hypothetical protein